MNAPMNLPDDFWQARQGLSHIRAAAYAKGCTPDVVLHCVLARLAAIAPHELRFDVGLGPGSLNLFSALIGASGTGKSTGAKAARELLSLPHYLDGTGFPDGEQLGSGEGLIERFMGIKEIPTLDVDTKGRPKVDKVRCQVRHNGFFYVDEGQALVQQMGRTGATIGPILRSAWGGESVGMANASTDTSRQLKDGSYSLGLVIGFQRSTAQPVLEDAVAGTPQRFLWGVSTDPHFPDLWPADPGPLDVCLTDQQWLSGRQGISGVIEAVGDIRNEVQTHHAKVKRGELEVPLLDSHRTYTMGKVAALLALLDGRLKIELGDWQLAGMVWAASCAVRDDLVAYGMEQARAKQEASNRAAVARQNSLADAQDQREHRIMEAVAKIIAKHVADKPGRTTSAIRKQLNSRYRKYWEDALAWATGNGWVTQHAQDLGVDEPVIDLRPGNVTPQ